MRAHPLGRQCPLGVRASFPGSGSGDTMALISRGSTLPPGTQQECVPRHLQLWLPPGQLAPVQRTSRSSSQPGREEAAVLGILRVSTPSFHGKWSRRAEPERSVVTRTQAKDGAWSPPTPGKVESGYGGVWLPPSSLPLSFLRKNPAEAGINRVRVQSMGRWGSQPYLS